MLSLKYLVLALAAVAEAGKLYGCAGTCIGKAITATGCSSSNSQCICSSVMFMETIKDCAASDCTEAQTESALTVAEEFCNLIGDDLPQLTHEKRGGRGHGGGRGGHWHGRPQWQGNGAPAAPETPAGTTEFPNWSAEGERIGQGGQEGGGRPGFGGGRPGFGGGRPGFEGGPPEFEGGPPEFEGGPPEFEGGPPEFEGGRPGFEGGRPSFGGGSGHGAPPPQYTQTPSVSTPAQPAHTQAPPPKHPQPPAPAHTHSGQPTTITAAPTWTTGPSAPEHTVW